MSDDESIEDWIQRQASQDDGATWAIAYALLQIAERIDAIVAAVEDIGEAIKAAGKTAAEGDP